MFIWLIFFFVLGATIASFLNVVADRLPKGGSLVSPPSHCPVCKHRIASRDLVPIFSFLWLKGRCRYCSTAIPLRSFVVEVLTGLLFAFLYWRFGLSYELLIMVIYCCLFIVLAIIDSEHGILPNRIVYAGMIIALIITALGTLFSVEPSFTVNAIPRIHHLWVVNAAIGGAAGFLILFIIALISRGGMGWGDVKLTGFIGLAAGFPLVFVAIFLAVVSGGLVAVILLLLKVKRRKEPIPFGPFLAIATIATLVWGSELLHWYLSTSKLPIP